jgi:hypothetical protein
MEEGGCLGDLLSVPRERKGVAADGIFLISPLFLFFNYLFPLFWYKGAYLDGSENVGDVLFSCLV